VTPSFAPLSYKLAQMLTAVNVVIIEVLGTEIDVLVVCQLFKVPRASSECIRVIVASACNLTNVVSLRLAVHYVPCCTLPLSPTGRHFIGSTAHDPIPSNARTQ